MISPVVIQDVLVGITMVGGTALYYKGRVPAQTIKNLIVSNKSYIELDKARQASLVALEEKLKEATAKHVEDRMELTKSISDLQGQIKVYKELPLRELADGINEIGRTNLKILERLETSATTLVANTHDAAIAVQGVRSDLITNAPIQTREA